MEGQGTITLENGTRISGDWKRGKQHGQGKYESKGGGYIFKGYYKEGLRDGQGKETYKSGKGYVGEYLDDKEHGQGTETMKNGDMF